MILKSDPNFEEILALCLNIVMRNLMNLTQSVERLKICTLMGYFCRKYVTFKLKKGELCREK